MYGDSNVLNDWVKGKVTLHVVLLEHLLERIKQLKASFHNLQISHIYMELNEESSSF